MLPQPPGRGSRPSKPPHARLDSQLNDLVAQLGQRPESEIAAQAPLAEGASVAVRIHTSRRDDGIDRLIHAAGGRVATVVADAVEAYVPVSALVALSGAPGVLSVRRIVPPQPLVTSQGTTVHNSPAWNNNGYIGAGIKVGIIDVGFIGYGGLRGTELPSAVAARCYTSLGVFTSNAAACEAGSVHGTAVAEAIFDMAPGASFYIANPQSWNDLNATVSWMASQGVNIINHSVGWSWEGPGTGVPLYSTSPLASVNLAVANGILWVNAAGNEGQSTWTGGYLETNGNEWIEFTPGIEVDRFWLNAGTRVVAQARWDDSWTAAARDLDLYLYLYLYNSSTGSLVQSSTADQSGIPGETPYEVLGYTAPTSGWYELAMYHYSGTAPSQIQIQAMTGQMLTYRTAAYSIANPAESASAGLLAVGAARWSSTSTIETFSSLGPTLDNRIKPDLVGADGGDSVTYGPGAFFGTSQAAPHVTGLAALAKGVFSTYTPAQLASYLKSQALARGLPVPNNTWGSGFAFLPDLRTVSIGDSTVLEGNSGTTNAIFSVTLSSAATETVSVSYATSNGTATASSDYTAASGTVTFPSGSTIQTISVAVSGDTLHEADETYKVTLSSPSYAVLADSEGTGTIQNDDPAPLMAISDVTVTEGNSGTVAAVFDVTLSAPSALMASASFTTSDNTALAGGDYTPVSGTVVFSPGALSQTVTVPVLGDTVDEPLESFALILTNLTTALPGRLQARGRIVDDDGGNISMTQLTHGQRIEGNLEAQAGPTADRDLYLVSLAPYSSYEIIVDNASGDVGSGQGPSVQRLAPDLTTVLATAAPIGIGPSRTLRLVNGTDVLSDAYVRVESSGCTVDCGADDRYRIRAYETTYTAPRFNNSGTQMTVVLLQNTTDAPITGKVWFWTVSGTLAGSSDISLAAKQTLVLNTSLVPEVAGQSGSMSITHNGGYGALAGKAVMLEAATGFSFDTPFVLRVR